MEFWEAAMTFKGTPFRHRGRSANFLDCVGLAKLAGIAAGFPYPVQDLKVYGREPWRDGLRQMLRANYRGVFFSPDEREPQVNDLVLIQRPESAGPSHVGIICPHPDDPAGLGLVHTYAEEGSVTWHRLSPEWRAQIVEIYAWPAKQ